MAKRMPAEALEAIETVVRSAPDGLRMPEIADRIGESVPRRTLQDRVVYLVNEGRLFRAGSGRWTKYHWKQPTEQSPEEATETQRPSQESYLRLSRPGSEVLRLVSKPIHERRPVSYNRDFLDKYIPNKTFYLRKRDREQLLKQGQTDLPDEPAGTYAKQILQRLLIDLSFHSSRLEGNTYTLLDTKKLLELGHTAEGKAEKETQMILNHKDAIDFLVEDAVEIGFNRQTILNLHGLLSNNLLSDSAAMGRLRWIGVEIGGSTYLPLGVPQLIDEVFNEILSKIASIDDPFEQSFFALVHFAYLQPFEDVNKRVSRLAANIPLIKANLKPLSFIDVPRDLYTSGMLGVYELNRIELVRDVFLWAYKRSAENYVAVRQSLGDPDPFKLAYRMAMRDAIGHVVRSKLDMIHGSNAVKEIARTTVPPEDRQKFVEVVMSELMALHEGNYARFRIRPSEFHEWSEVWRKRALG